MEVVPVRITVSGPKDGAAKASSMLLINSSIMPPVAKVPQTNATHNFTRTIDRLPEVIGLYFFEAMDARGCEGFSDNCSPFGARCSILLRQQVNLIVLKHRSQQS